MNNPQPTNELVLDYLQRGRATTVNVASHFGMLTGAAQRVLFQLEDTGAIRSARTGTFETWEVVNGKQ